MNLQIKTNITIVILMTLSAAMAGSYVWLYQDNQRLEQQAEELRKQVTDLRMQEIILNAHAELTADGTLKK
jgi:cytochrome c-type biogenesis protein CcmH/NrfG